MFNTSRAEAGGTVHDALQRSIDHQCVLLVYQPQIIQPPSARVRWPRAEGVLLTVS